MLRVDLLRIVEAEFRITPGISPGTKTITMQLVQNVFRLLLYLWVGPGSLVGLFAALIAVCRGGRGQIVDGVLEISGGGVTRLLSRFSVLPGEISAITLGHVVIGATKFDLDRTRIHERVHVRQYERWGPLFIPAYLLASVWVRLRGGHPYLENPFEVEAYRVSDGRVDA
jgi:hypothetical protein